MKLLLALSLLFINLTAAAFDSRCPEADVPPPPVLKADLPRLSRILGQVLSSSNSLEAPLKEIFESVPQKTKLNQFFALLLLIQKNIRTDKPSVVVRPPEITNLLLAARVFTRPDFPRKITSVELKRTQSGRPPLYKVDFSEKEVRFPINEGRGFASWDQGMCQIAKELVFYPGFSFRVHQVARGNLIVDDFDGVEIYGQFGTRRIVSIDLNYVDLERVEFINGTDEGKVKARVAKREFRENPHSALFRWIGSMIPNTSRQRIDW